MPFDGLQLFTDKGSLQLTEDIGDTDKTTPVFADSYVFEEMRMEVRNQRSQLEEQLKTKVSSSEYTAVEKSGALDEMAKLTKRSSAEALMELEIIALGYPEAFVHSEDGEVKVTVLSAEGQSAKMADEIIQYVKTSWDDARKVQVVFTGGTE